MLTKIGKLNKDKKIDMKHIFTSKEIIKEWCEKNMKTHTDWTGTYVETEYKCDSVDEFVDKLYEYLEDNHHRC